MLCKALTTLGGNAEDAYEEFERYHLRPALWCPLQATTSPSPYAWTDDARDSRIEISHDQLLAASWSSRFSLQLRPHSFDCPGGYWRSAAGEPRDDDQLDDCYCIGAGGNNYPFPESPGDWPIRSYAKHAAFRDFHFKTMVGLWIFDDPRRAERVELATHRALRDRRAPVPSSSREVYCLKDLEHVQQTLRQTLKLSNQQLLQLQSEDLKDARRNKRGQQMPEASLGYWVCSFSSSSCKTRLCLKWCFTKDMLCELETMCELLWASWCPLQATTVLLSSCDEGVWARVFAYHHMPWLLNVWPVEHICKSFSLSLTAIGQIDPNCFFFSA